VNDFDRFLEFELRQMLDPVVVSGAPRRRTRKKANGPPAADGDQGSLDLALEPRRSRCRSQSAAEHPH